MMAMGWNDNGFFEPPPFSSLSSLPNDNIPGAIPNNEIIKPTTTTVKPRHPETRLQSDWLFLLEKLPPNQWYSSDYAYKTSGWLNVHTNIRKRQRILRQLSEEYLMGALNWDNYRSQVLQRIGTHVLKL